MRGSSLRQVGVGFFCPVPREGPSLPVRLVFGPILGHTKGMRLIVAVLLMCSLEGFASELRVWTEVSGRKIQAYYEGRKGDYILLRKTNSTIVGVRLSRLVSADRAYLKGMALAAKARPALNRDRVWRPYAGEHPWPKSLQARERVVLDQLGIKWAHAESQYFVIHYDRAAFAQKVARMGDFYYSYMAHELQGMKDRYPRKSHIFVFRKSEKWDDFLRKFDTQYGWASAFVRGDLMFIQEYPSSRRSEDTLAHEMTHLVLNRFFKVQPPRWLNEGLAEWYEEFARAEFKGVGHRPRAVFHHPLEHYLPLQDLMAAEDYPDEKLIRAYYATSKYMVGFLRLAKGDQAFVRYLNDIVSMGLPPELSLQKHYGYSDLADLEHAFIKFAGVRKAGKRDPLANE